MRLPRITLLRLVLPITLVLLSGCGLPLPGRPVRPADPLPPDRLVFLVQSGGGLALPVTTALSTPALAVYGDGRVLAQRDNASAGRIPGAYAVAMVGPDTLAQFAAEAENTGLFDPDTDLGTPDVTDLPSTTVTLHASSGPGMTRVYGLDERFDEYVSFGERRLRRQLRDVVDRAYRLPSGAQQTDYRVERVRVSEVSLLKEVADAADWRGPEPATFLRWADQRYGLLGCGELIGDQARAAYADARANPGQVWTVGSQQRLLAVAPVLPGQPTCPS